MAWIMVSSSLIQVSNTLWCKNFFKMKNKIYGLESNFYSTLAQPIKNELH